MRIFDYSFLKNAMFPATLLRTTAAIYALRVSARHQKIHCAKAFTELESLARVQSVKSSNAIEGIITSDARIKAIVEESSAPLTHNEAEIAGYRDVLNIIHTQHNALAFNEKNILNMHRMLMSYAGYEHGGTYKAEDNLILETDPEGRRRIRFRPVPASQTREAMEQLILAYEDARNDPLIDQLLLIPCVILDFLCIHPFRDGNGRLSRLLSLLLLYKNGFEAGKYISFEAQVNKEKQYYYGRLKESSEGWMTNENNYVPFIENFLFMLYLCYKELNSRFAMVEQKKITKKSRVELAVRSSLMPLSKADICQLYPDISPTTVEAALGDLCRSEKIQKVGKGRGTRYKASNNE
ncbi:MAG: Fic family protein [Mailhella sp.]